MLTENLSAQQCCWRDGRVDRQSDTDVLKLVTFTCCVALKDRRRFWMELEEEIFTFPWLWVCFLPVSQLSGRSG